MYELPSPSTEQVLILNDLKEGKSVRVNAVAGSGKTTTCLHIAQSLPSTNILLLTYNAKLKMETRRKVDDLGLSNMEVHSFHAFCVRYFVKDGYRDNGILKYLRKHPFPPLLLPFHYDLVIIDECQDMTPLYFELVLRIVYHISKKSPCVFPNIVVMGDAKQSIFQFNRADSRFLTEASHIFPMEEAKWTERSLQTTFRLTLPMTEFLGDCCEGSPQMIPFKYPSKYSSKYSSKLPSPVHYMICNSFSKSPFHQIQKFLKKYAYDDIFILAPSVKSPMTPARKLANLLTENGVPVFVPTSDEDSLDEDVLRGKVVFSTFHQVKGLERKVVMVFQFDDSYMHYFAKDIPLSEQHLIPNTLYVALTRAKEHLVLIHDKKHPFLSFVNKSKVMSSRHVRMDIVGGGSRNGLSESLQWNLEKKDKNYQKMSFSSTEKFPEKLSVLELVKYTPADILQLCMEKLDVQQCFNQCLNQSLKEYSKDTTTQPHVLSLSLPTKSQQGEGYENVAEITSVAIPMYFEYLQTGKPRIMTKTKQQKTQTPLFFPLSSRTKEGSMTVPELLERATEWCCEKSGYAFKQNQIIDYSWLPPAELTKACTHLSEMIEFVEKNKRNENNVLEMEYEKRVEKSWEGTTMFGFLDMTSQTSLYEIKIQKEVETIHFLQCALYLWLNERKTERRQSQHPFSMFSYIPRPSSLSSSSSFPTSTLSTTLSTTSSQKQMYLLHVPTHNVYKISFLTETSGDEILRILWDYKYNNKKEDEDRSISSNDVYAVYSQDPFIQRCKEMWVK